MTKTITSFCLLSILSAPAFSQKDLARFMESKDIIPSEEFLSLYQTMEDSSYWDSSPFFVTSCREGYDQALCFAVWASIYKDKKIVVTSSKKGINYGKKLLFFINKKHSVPVEFLEGKEDCFAKIGLY